MTNAAPGGAGTALNFRVATSASMLILPPVSRQAALKFPRCGEAAAAIVLPPQILNVVVRSPKRPLTLPDFAL